MRAALFATLIAGSAAADESGLAAWDRIYEIAAHPRCTNCHVGPQEEPMWEGLSYGAGRVHGMGVKADESRIGAESTPCRTCHITAESDNSIPHAPPQILEAWRLPPLELAWLGADSATLCAQLSDPEQNDGFGAEGLAEHVMSSPFVAWGFAPGGGRSAPPGTPASLAEDIRLWGAAGYPCR